MELTYLLGAAVAVAVAIWMQRTTSMARGYAWLSRIGALVFALLFAPRLANGFDLATGAQAVVFISLPLIAVPYQVRMMRFIERSKTPTPTRGAPGIPGARGPGGGRVRSRRRTRR